MTEIIILIAFAAVSWVYGYFYCKLKRLSMFASMMDDRYIPEECKNIVVKNYGAGHKSITADLSDNFDEKADTFVLVMQRDTQ